MIKVKESSYKNQIGYVYEVFHEGKKISEKKINYETYEKELEGTLYLIIYSPLMEPMSEAFSFLNYEIGHQSISTRLQSQLALKLLFSFQELISKELLNFNVKDINNFILFLKGVSPSGNLLQLNLLTHRSNGTINGYLTVYRKFLAFLGQENKLLMMKKPQANINFQPNFEQNHIKERYSINERKPINPIEVPRYISIEDFRKILKIVRSDYSKREEVIIRLMFQCGCRIGEVLGATPEDFAIEKINNEDIAIFNIRNRYSDKKDQLAKTCLSITDKSQYSSKEYLICGYGYQKVLLPRDLYDKLIDYFEESHELALEKHSENYQKYTIADSVLSGTELEENCYIFLNSLGKPLSQVLWNKTLREIFLKAGLNLDKDVRKHNLNHRFRHGFAMFNVLFLKCKEIELMERMRHKDLSSVECYFKPTLEDQTKIKNRYIESLYEIIPEL